MADDDPQPMSQEEIDALFAQLENESGQSSKADAPQAKPEEAAPAEAEDAEAEVAAASEAVEEPEPTVEAAADDAAIQDATLDQAAIDALVAESAEEEAPAAEAPAAQAEETDAPSGEAEASGGDGVLSQDSIDALLAEMGGEPEATADADEPAAANPDDPMGQDSIDALLAEMGVEDGAQASAEEVEAPAAEADDENATADQDEIDALVNSIQREEGGEANPRESLTTDEIQKIMSKQEEDEEAGEDADIESMINQEDIDALVRQMSEATGIASGSDHQAAAPSESSDLDTLLNEVGNEPAAPQAMAPSASMMLDQSHSAPAARQMQVPAGVMPAEELRGTRYLLFSAVVLLAMCAVTLGYVVSAINGLTTTLQERNESEIKPTGDYENNLNYARQLIDSEDQANQAKGESLLVRMKSGYPKRRAELSRVLADHYRRQGALGEAVEEFKQIQDSSDELHSDPMFYLEYAESLLDLKRYQKAKQVLYTLLANSGRYTSETDRSDQPRSPEAIAKGERAVQRGRLLLGRLHLEYINDVANVEVGDAGVNGS